mmetsp:Transcript_58835/g.140111  ORF Transcript_58835/g.140111 Transcript_58835/m.140111 type:complete len:310 (+) Transcript_58835:1375-2304(+)
MLALVSALARRPGSPLSATPSMPPVPSSCCSTPMTTCGGHEGGGFASSSCASEYQSGKSMVTLNSGIFTVPSSSPSDEAVNGLGIVTSTCRVPSGKGGGRGGGGPVLMISLRGLRASSLGSLSTWASSSAGLELRGSSSFLLSPRCTILRSGSAPNERGPDTEPGIGLCIGPDCIGPGCIPKPGCCIDMSCCCIAGIICCICGMGGCIGNCIGIMGCIMGMLPMGPNGVIMLKGICMPKGGIPIPGIPMPMPKPPKPAFPPLPPPPFPPPFFPPFLIHGGSGCPMPSPFFPFPLPPMAPLGSGRPRATL